jgi:hypothetical protein
MYATNADVPQDVRDRFPGHCTTVWRQTWNDTFDRHGDEGRAFATAETAGKLCKESVMPVKFVKDAPDMIEGLAIPFGGPLAGKDLEGESFSAATDLCLPWFGETGRPVLYGHGLHPATKTDVVGRQTSLETRDEGQWVQVELDKSSRYRAKINQLVDQGALSFSSGAMPHLVQTTKDGKITRWPWVELSLTPTPANPFAAVYAVKSADMAEHFAAANIDIPGPLAAALKALDEWAAIRDDPLAGSSYAEESDRLLDALKAFAERTQGLADLRVKEGRTLSAANRDRLSSHVDAIGTAMESMRSTMADMRALLAATDPQAGKRLADAALAEWEYLSMTLPRI